ncbi:MAG: hypothetical protein ISS31_07680 [Kiritimatiellae bacterium]|nr:hypothetical protein [Kiritimatiellia bacterium]
MGFSIWFLQIAYAIYIMVRSAYLPPYDGQMIVDQRIGAWIALPAGILWLGRRHWLNVLKSVFQKAGTGEELRNKVAGTALLIGMAGMLFWLLWVRVPALWAIALVDLMFLFALGLTRIVAETGVPLMAPDTNYLTTLANLVPVAWRTAAGMYFSGVMGIVAGHLNRVCVTTVMCHALGLDKKAAPRRHVRLAGIFFGVLILSVLIGGGHPACADLPSYHLPGRRMVAGRLRRGRLLQGIRRAAPEGFRIGTRDRSELQPSSTQWIPILRAPATERYRAKPYPF